MSSSSYHDALAQLSPALRRVLDVELKRGNEVAEVEVEGPFVQVLLTGPLTWTAHHVAAHVDRFACGPRDEGEPPLAGFGDDATGHTIAGPDDGARAAAEAPDIGARNRQLSSDTPLAVEWHPDDSTTLARLKRAAQKFKWKNPASIRALRDLMLVLFALDRLDEARSLALFLARREFDHDEERWEPVQSALAMLHHLAAAEGDLDGTQRYKARLKEGGLDPLRVEGALLEEIRGNAELQSPRSGPRREWELQWLNELILLEVFGSPSSVSPEAIAHRQAAIRHTLD